MKYIDHVCKQCGKTFSAPNNQKDRKFCSRECFFASMRTPGRRCVVCGKPIDRRRGKTVRCCSYSCAGVLKIREGKVRKKEPPKMEERTCEQCGKTFTVEHSSTRKFCSSKCRSERYRQAYATSGIKEPRVCPQCGKEFMPNCKQQMFCSSGCSQEARRGGPVSAPMVDIRITADIPVYEHLRPAMGRVYRAEDHRVYGGPFFIVPDICGKRIVVRVGECEVVEDGRKE